MKCKKKAYRTELDAKIALANMARNDLKRGKPGLDKRRERRQYRCQCGSWHTTSQPLKEDSNAS